MCFHFIKRQFPNVPALPHTEALQNGELSYTNSTTGAEESQGEFAYRDADAPNTPLVDAPGDIDINSIYGDGENDAGNDFQSAMSPVSPSVKQSLTPPSSEGGSGRVVLKGRSEFDSEEAINRLVIEKPTLAMQIKNALVKTYDKAKTYFTDKEAYEARYAMSELEKGIKLFEKALDTRRNFKDFAQRLSGNVSGDVQYFANGSEKSASIKEQLANEITELSNMKNVKEINYELKGSNKAEKRNSLMQDLLSGLDLNVTREGLGEVVINKKLIKESFKYLNTEEEYVAFGAIPEVIKNGKQIYYNANHKNRGYPTYTFAAPVMINGKKGYMGVSVRVTDGNKYKMHRVLFPDGATLEFADNKNAEATTPAPSSKTTDIRTITSTPNIIAGDVGDVKDDFQFAYPVASDKDLKNNSENDIINSDELNDYVAELPVTKIKAKHFPSYKVSGSDAHEQAARWAHREDVVSGARRYATHSGSWYVIEKFDSMTDKYQIVGKVNTKEFEKLVNEVKKYGKSEQYSAQREIDANVGGDTAGNKSSGRGRSDGTDAVEYSGESNTIRTLGENKIGGREVYGNTDRGNEYDGKDRWNSQINDDFQFSSPAPAETQQEFGNITTRRAYDYFKKNRNAYKRQIGEMFVYKKEGVVSIQ